MKLFNKDGIEMMDVKSIGRDQDRLVIKGKMMGSMATTIFVAPEDLWSAFRLLSIDTIIRLPVLVARGWARSRRRQ